MKASGGIYVGARGEVMKSFDGLIKGAAFGVLASLGMGLVIGGMPQSATAQPQVIVVSDEDRHAGEFVIPVNKSQVLRLDVVLKDLLVGNPEIADVLALTDRSIYVLGKSVGSTSLTLYGANRQLIAVMDLIVTYDIDGLKSKLFEVMPEENIEVRAAGNTLMLSGRVSSATRLSEALEIASRYAGGTENLTNLMNVMGSQQVMLEVRFAEVSRAISRDIDFNFNILDDDFFLVSGNVAPDPASFANVGTIDTSLGGGVSMSLFFDALEGKGLARTLAEPNLTALSGETATFLAGGEFPIPVAQDTDAITVEFKEFGVSLAFTPTVLAGGLVNVAVGVEESRIDPTRPDATVDDFVVPSLITRRAQTTVEMRDGQSFAIAGLIRNDFSDTITQFPGLGDVPVLGTLFRSTGFLRQESELVILVTPRLVQPAPAGTLMTPDQNLDLPTDLELFLFGRLEGAGTDAASGTASAASTNRVFSAQSAGGIDGAYGHIVK